MFRVRSEAYFRTSPPFSSEHTVTAGCSAREAAAAIFAGLADAVSIFQSNNEPEVGLV